MKIYKFAITCKEDGLKLSCVVDGPHFSETIEQLLFGGHQYTWEEADVAPHIAHAILHPARLYQIPEGDRRNV
jgi:hypothetical protein